MIVLLIVLVIARWRPAVSFQKGQQQSSQQELEFNDVSSIMAVSLEPTFSVLWSVWCSTLLENVQSLKTNELQTGLYFLQYQWWTWKSGPRSVNNYYCYIKNVYVHVCTHGNPWRIPTFGIFLESCRLMTHFRCCLQFLVTLGSLYYRHFNCMCQWFCSSNNLRCLTQGMLLLLSPSLPQKIKSKVAFMKIQKTTTTSSFPQSKKCVHRLGTKLYYNIARKFP